MSERRVKATVSYSVARNRLVEYRMTHGFGPHHAATLADVIWTDAKWRSPQGAGAAAGRVLKRLGCSWTEQNGKWGWMLIFPNEKAER